MKNRLSRIFNPRAGRTVMLAFDHGYIMGPTTGLERMDLNIPPLIPYADCLMCTRGALQTCIPPATHKPLVLRAHRRHGPDGPEQRGHRRRRRGRGPAERRRRSRPGLHRRDARARDARQPDPADQRGNRYGIPTLAVTAVGKEMARDARYLGLACRVAAEIGAHIRQDLLLRAGFDEVVAGCPVPIVIAGGKKLPELDALTWPTRRSTRAPRGVDMGRNIFLAEDPRRHDPGRARGRARARDARRRPSTCTRR